MNNRISRLSRLLLWISALLLIASLFVPLWRIDLDAPQYPEGLRLLIWPDKIAGDVDIINGLNHYIGMKTLHTGDFIEFRLLPFLISAYALLFAIAALKARKGWLYGVFIAFVLFGIIAMIDFWKWEYNYGHNLDPNAAIRVPGMAYQPPLIGFKQLLNFGAYSIPDIGGWLFLLTGILLLAACFEEISKTKRHLKKGSYAALILLYAGLFSGCRTDKPEPIALHKDACDYCRMGIADGRFAVELITKKGRVYKFDDLHCLSGFMKEKKPETRSFFINDYPKDNELIDATSAFYVQHETINGPMGGHTAAFRTEEAAKQFSAGLQTGVSSWDAIRKTMLSDQTHDAP
ncbi:NosL [compost metagenome]